eukprot:EG_transcript_28966
MPASLPCASVALLLMAAWGKAAAQCSPSCPCCVATICAPAESCSATRWRTVIWTSVGAGTMAFALVVAILIWCRCRPKKTPATRSLEFGEPVEGIALAVGHSNTPTLAEAQVNTVFSDPGDGQPPCPHLEEDTTTSLGEGLYGPLVDDPAAPTATPSHPVAVCVC